MFSSFFTSPRPRPPLPRSSRSLFTSLIHGDLGRLVADSLSVHDLCQWSRCDRNGRTIVSYKYSHMKYFNLDEVKYTTPHNFARLCTRLRGIEVLQYSVTLPALMIDQGLKVTPTTTNGSSAASASALAYKPDSIRLLQWYELIQANQHILRCIRQTAHTTAAIEEAAILGVEPQSMHQWYIERVHVQPILASLHLMPQLQSLQFATWIRSTIIEELLKRVNSRTTGQEEDDELGSLSIQTNEFQRLSAAATSLLQQHDARSGPPSRQSDLRLIEPILIQQSQLRPFINTFSRLESIHTALVSIQDELEEKNEKEDEDEMQMNLTSNMPVTSLMTISLESGMSRSVNFFSHLLYLKLNLSPFVFPHGSVLSLQLPSLLQLNLPHALTNACDIVLDMPSLITLTCHVKCRASQAKLLQQRIQLTDTPIYFAPPSFISSLRRSPKLENFVFDIDTKESLLCDYTLVDEELTSEEMRIMDEKAKGLGRSSLFAPYTQETRRESCLTIFYYALSILPCGSTLKMIDESPRYISLLEYFTLYPSAVTIAQTPTWNHVLSYYRPQSIMDGSSSKYIEEKILQKLRRPQTTKNSTCEVTEEDAMNCGITLESINYWQIAHHLNAIPLAAIQVVAQSGRLEHLIYLFLHSISNVESTALTLLFLECHSLEHASLMQLPGIGNSVFIDLPHDCVRSTLSTLRIKTPCGGGEKEGDSTFTGDLLPRLTQLFPCISHFEYLFTLRPQYDMHVTRVHSQLSYILAFNQPSVRSFSRSLVWPRLTILTINQHANQIDDLQLQKALLSRRLNHRQRTEQPISSQSLLQLFLASPTNAPQEMDSRWHHALRGATNVHSIPPRTQNGVVDAGGAMTTMKLSVDYGHIPSCYRGMCAHHREKVSQQGSGAQTVAVVS